MHEGFMNVSCPILPPAVCFKIYDVNNDQYVNENEVYSLLASMLVVGQSTRTDVAQLYEEVLELTMIVLQRLVRPMLE